MKRALLAVPVVLLVLYLLAWPTPLEPHAWTAPAPMPFSGPFAPNEKLKGVEWWAKQLVGPEAITFDPEGRLVTGLRDGRIVRLKVGDDTPTLVADTKGRPMAMAYHPDGRLIICDANLGLLALDAAGTLTTLSAGLDGIPFRFTDDLDITPEGLVYFTDASARHPIARFEEDLLEHQTTGRLLKYDPATRKTSLVADGFNFSNGVALGPDAAWLLMTETGAYRVWRVWLEGEKAGQKEVFAELPGFPDNIRYAKDRHVFWVAVGSPRQALVDALAPYPFLRKVISRLPKAVQPAPERHGMVVGLDESGKVVENLQYRAADSYSPIASAVERDGHLYLGSFAREGVARLKLP